MIFKQGKYLNNEFGNLRPFQKFYELLDISITVYSQKEENYEILVITNNAIYDFFKHFNFLKCEKAQSVVYHPINENDKYQDYNIKLFSWLDPTINNKNEVNNILSDELGATIAVWDTKLLYNGICEFNEESLPHCNFSIVIDNRRYNHNNSILSFTWDFGSEWFYNEYSEINKEILRNAIVKFYESNANFRDMEINYYLSGFDLDLKLSKPFKVNRNSH